MHVNFDVFKIVLNTLVSNFSVFVSNVIEIWMLQSLIRCQPLSVVKTEQVFKKIDPFWRGAWKFRRQRNLLFLWNREQVSLTLLVAAFFDGLFARSTNDFKNDVQLVHPVLVSEWVFR